MHIVAVTPLSVSPEELARRQRRYDRLAPVGVTVALHNLGTGRQIPRSLDTEEAIAASEAAVEDWFRSADGSGVDAFLPDCVLDPAVGLAGQQTGTPVLGILRLTGHFLRGQGLRVGAVARNESIARELNRKYASYGLGPLHEPTSVLGLSVDDIADDEKWAASIRGRVTAIEADVVINGCSAVETHSAGSGAILVDPTALALQLIGLAAASGAVAFTGAGR
jgi:Asp/Glu/hydantoin racemase